MQVSTLAWVNTSTRFTVEYAFFLNQFVTFSFLLLLGPLVLLRGSTRSPGHLVAAPLHMKNVAIAGFLDAIFCILTALSSPSLSGAYQAS